MLLETADLERLTEDVAHRRAEVEASLHRALEEDLRVLEIQRATDDSLRSASAQNLWLEPEICQRTDIDQSLLEETCLRERYAVEELERISFGAQEQATQEEQMLSKLEDIPSQLVVAAQATAPLDVTEEGVENVRSLQAEQEEPAEKRKSAAVSIVG